MYSLSQSLDISSHIGLLNPSQSSVSPVTISSFTPKQNIASRSHLSSCLPISFLSTSHDYCRVPRFYCKSLQATLSSSPPPPCPFPSFTSIFTASIYPPHRLPQSKRETMASAANVVELGAIEEAALAGQAVGGELASEKKEGAEVETGEWMWEGHKIRYQKSGSTGTPLLLIHGFGANCDHWRKNLPVLGSTNRVFAIDLLGYGFSSKPDPRKLPPNSLYTFDTWARQTLSFVDEVIGEPAFVACNSVGGNVGLKAALEDPAKIRGLLLLNVSLRQLHVKKQAWYIRPFVKALQTTLRTTEIGRLFFASVATPDSVKQILQQCYCDKSQVTDELVEVILKPGLEGGAVDVFLDFICYSGGPLPEDMLPLVKCPVVIGWGEEDPWEPINLGKLYGEISTVDEFVILPGVGHCPQDEAPHLVNPLIERFVAKYSKTV